MKIAYVTSDDPNDIRSWSGVPVFMSAAFERIGHTVRTDRPAQGDGGRPFVGEAAALQGVRPAVPARP